MSKASVPIPYIIALVLAIAVISIVVYWLFFSGADFGKTILEKGCDAKLLAFCNDVSVSGGAASFSTDCESINDGNRDSYSNKNEPGYKVYSEKLASLG